MLRSTDSTYMIHPNIKYSLPLQIHFQILNPLFWYISPTNTRPFLGPKTFYWVCYWSRHSGTLNTRIHLHIHHRDHQDFFALGPPRLNFFAVHVHTIPLLPPNQEVWCDWWIDEQNPMNRKGFQWEITMTSQLVHNVFYHQWRGYKSWVLKTIKSHGQNKTYRTIQ